MTIIMIIMMIIRPKSINIRSILLFGYLKGAAEQKCLY